MMYRKTIKIVWAIVAVIMIIGMVFFTVAPGLGGY